MKIKIIVIMSLLLLSMPVMAADTKGVEDLLRVKLDAVIDVLRNKDIKKKERHKKIIEIVEPVFDFSKMAKLTLGKKYWPGLSKENKKKFSKLFIKRIKKSYLEKLDIYTDERVNYKPPEWVSKKKVRIMTELVSVDNRITMLYKFYKSRKKGWLIYDIEIQGVSIISTYRTQFDQVLRTGTINDLLLKLKEMGNK